MDEPRAGQAGRGESARLVRLDGAGPAVPLEPGRSLTIGRDPACGFCLAQEAGLSRRHAELRPDPAGGWWLHDLGSRNGTFLEGERLQGPRLLRPGERFRLGGRGPLLQFLQGARAEVAAAAAGLPPAARNPGAQAAGSRPPRAEGPGAVPPPPTPPPPTPPAAAPPVTPAAGPPGALAGAVAVAGRQVPLALIRSVELRSEARHPQLFSWWVLACLGGLLLLPFPWIFWPWQGGSLALALFLARRREHTLLLTLRDGQAHRHRFADRATAQAHHQGLRRSLGQIPGP
jgi:hypothetical protein